ncbi:MAG: hypothetical protein WC711_03455 [Candidatus Staskawiczbacteria bacterium]|jgi:hypothetical protein
MERSRSENINVDTDNAAGQEAGDYKAFARAAKEVGIDKNERKAMARNPDKILEGASETVKDYVTPESIEMFFSALQRKNVGGKENLERRGINARNRAVLGIGNFLYNLRPDAKFNSVDIDDLNENDLRLIALSCNLVENAFYDGKLSANFAEGEAAPIAFVTNVLAKILEGGDAGQKFKGFDKAKAHSFIAKVKKFEESVLFSDVKSEDATAENEDSAREESIERADKEIDALLAKADGIMDETVWEEYFGNIAEKLIDAPRLLRQAGMDFYDFQEEDIREIATALQNWGTITDNIKSKSEFVRQRISTGKVIDDGPLPGKLYGLGSRYQNRRIDPAKPYEPYLDIQRSADAISGWALEIKQKFEGSRIKETNKYKSFNEAVKLDSLKKLPGIAEALMAVVGELQGPLREYVECYQKAIEISNRRIDGIKQDEIFINGEQRLLEQLEQKRSAVAYLIKSCLIVDDRINKHSEDYRAKKEADLVRGVGLREGMFNIDLRQVVNDEVHEFSGYFDKPFAKLHFKPDDIPFAVWAIRYLRSLNEKK